MNIHDVEWTDEKIERFWSNIIQLESKDETWFTYAAGDAVINFVNCRYPLKNTHILDYGTGKGFLLKHLLKIKNTTVSVCDTSTESLHNIDKNYGGVILKQALIDKLPSSLPDNFFDFVFLLEVVEHLSDNYLEETLKEINRVLKPNGKLIITTPNNEILESSMMICPDCACKYHRWQHLRSWNRKSLSEFVEKYKFTTNGIWETDIMQYKNGIKGKGFYLKNILKGFFKQTIPPNLIHVSSKNE